MGRTRDYVGVRDTTFPRGALAFILVAVALDAVGLGILIPVIPKLIAELTGEGLNRAVIYGGWLTALFALLQFFAGPVLGSLSDHFGRRPVLLLSLSAFGMSYARLENEARFTRSERDGRKICIGQFLKSARRDWDCPNCALLVKHWSAERCPVTVARMPSRRTFWGIYMEPSLVALKPNLWKPRPFMRVGSQVYSEIQQFLIYEALLLDDGCIDQWAGVLPVRAR